MKTVHFSRKRFREVRIEKYSAMTHPSSYTASKNDKLRRVVSGLLDDGAISQNLCLRY